MNSVFGQVSAATSALTSNSAIANLGPKEVSDKLETLASDATSALSKPVSFVTQPLNSAISGAKTMTKGGSGLVDMLSGVTEGALGNISKAVGMDITTSADISTAINKVTDALASNTGKSLGSLKDAISSVTSGSGLDSVSSVFTSSIGSFTDSLSNGVNNTIKSFANTQLSTSAMTAGLTSFINGKPERVSNSNTYLTNSNSVVASSNVSSVSSTKAINALAQSSTATNNLVSQDPKAVADKTAQTVADTAENISYIQSQLDETVKLDEITDSLLMMGLGTEYAAMIDAAGDPLYEKVGDNKEDFITSMYSAIGKLDSTITKPETQSAFRRSKNLYDVVLKIAADKGMTDLITKMSANTTYFDDRSKSVLKDCLPTVAKSGNPYTYSAIVDILGLRNIPDNTNNLKTLYANLYTNDPLASTAYSDLLTKCGTNILSLSTTNNNVTKDTVYDASSVTLMAASDPTLLDETLGSDQRQLMQASVYLFANR